MQQPAQSPLRPLALVTGAAARIGRAIALELAGLGYAVALHYHGSAALADATAGELSRKGVPVFSFQADLAETQQIDRLFEQVGCLDHPLKVLVNSAAVMTRGNLRDLAVEEWDRLMDLNLRAPWLCTRRAVPLMEKEGGGVVINISDSGAQQLWTGYPAYTVSKAGLEVLTRLMAKTLAPHIRVNAVAPGLIVPAPDFPPEEWQRLSDRLPLKKAGSPEDVARAVAFLVQNPYITGQVLVVDGGYQLL